jgi:Viral BACON domain/Putative binding domain, N-terminal
VTFTTAANTGSARVGTITIGGQPFTVNQAGSCASTINPASQSVAAAGGAATSVAVTSPAGCAWTATTAATWISITSGASGTGNGSVAFTAAANVGPLRTGTIAIAGQNHTVTQASGCVFAINPTSQSFGKNAATSGPIAVTTGATCSWTATANDSWITVTMGATGTGNGTVRFSITQNTTGVDRTGTLTIAGRTFTVDQNK